jgi:hypothetical protein
VLAFYAAWALPAVDLVLGSDPLPDVSVRSSLAERGHVTGYLEAQSVRE